MAPGGARGRGAPRGECLEERGCRAAGLGARAGATAAARSRWRVWASHHAACGVCRARAGAAARVRARARGQHSRFQARTKKGQAQPVQQARRPPPRRAGRARASLGRSPPFKSLRVGRACRAAPCARKAGARLAFLGVRGGVPFPLPPTGRVPRSAWRAPCFPSAAARSSGTQTEPNDPPTAPRGGAELRHAPAFGELRGRRRHGGGWEGGLRAPARHAAALAWHDVPRRAATEPYIPEHRTRASTAGWVEEETCSEVVEIQLKRIRRKPRCTRAAGAMLAGRGSLPFCGPPD